MLQCGLLRSNFSLAIGVLPAYGFKIRLERVAGIEPASSAWKAAALPLCYTRQETRGSPELSPCSLRRVVGEVGLEPTKPLQQRIYSPPPLPLGTFPQRAKSHIE